MTTFFDLREHLFHQLEAVPYMNSELGVLSPAEDELDKKHPDVVVLECLSCRKAILRINKPSDEDSAAKAAIVADLLEEEGHER